MRSARLFLVPAFAALSLVAQDGSLSGTWSQVRADDIAAAINTTVADMNFIKRPIARGRLTKLNPAYRKVVITISTQEVLIKLDERDAIHLPPPGARSPAVAVIEAVHRDRGPMHIGPRSRSGSTKVDRRAQSPLTLMSCRRVCRISTKSAASAITWSMSL